MNPKEASLSDEQRESNGVGEDELGAVNAVRAALPQEGPRKRLQVHGALGGGGTHI